MTQRRSVSRRRRIARRSVPAVAFAGMVMHLACSSSPRTATTPDDASSTGTSNDGGGSAADSSSGAADSSMVAASSLRDDGPPTCNAGAAPAGGATCAASRPTSATILGTSFASSGGVATYGSPPNAWIAYPAAGQGQSLPTLSPSPGAVMITGTVQHSSSGNGWAAIGLSISQGCVDTTQIGGVQFSISGSFGGCTLEVAVITPQDESAAADPCRGACTAGASGCIAPFAVIPQSQFVNGTTSIVFNGVSGGSPSPYGAGALIGLQWRFVVPEDASAGCAPNATLSGVMFLNP